MRIRFKPWAREELEASKFYIDNPQTMFNRWITAFENPENPIYLELGCGKGGFISSMAVQHPQINYIAIDMVDAMLGLAKRKIEQAYLEKNMEVNNVILTRFDIERIGMILGEKDHIQRIYINFCNPWPRGKHHKKRLTHTRQLEKYKTFLAEKGEIYFKTDDDKLYEDSLHYFQEAGFELIKKTNDLKQELNFWENVETEHEKMFSQEGIKIKGAIARK